MPQKFLDSKIIYEDNQIKTKVHRNERKLPVHCTRHGNTQGDYIIPPNFFDVPKPLVLAEIPYFPRN